MFLLFVLFKFSLSLAIFCCQLMLQRHVNFMLAGLLWFLISVASFAVGKTVFLGERGCRDIFMDMYNWYFSQLTQEASMCWMCSCACSAQGTPVLVHTQEQCGQWSGVSSLWWLAKNMAWRRQVWDGIQEQTSTMWSSLSYVSMRELNIAICNVAGTWHGGTPGSCRGPIIFTTWILLTADQSLTQLPLP